MILVSRLGAVLRATAILRHNRNILVCLVALGTCCVVESELRLRKSDWATSPKAGASPHIRGLPAFFGCFPSRPRLCFPALPGVFAALRARQPRKTFPLAALAAGQRGASRSPGSRGQPKRYSRVFLLVRRNLEVTSRGVQLPT